MKYDVDLERYVWTKEDWLFMLPAVIGGVGAVVFIFVFRWFYTGLWL